MLSQRYSGLVDGQEGHVMVDGKGVEKRIATVGGVNKQKENLRSTAGVFLIADPEIGQPITVQGKWFYDEKGNAVSAQYTNLKTGEIFTMQKVMDKGEETMQYGVSKSQIGPDGKRIYSFNSLSTQKYASGEFAVTATKGIDGKTIMKSAEGGQNVNWYDQYMQNEEIGSKQSLLRPIVGFGADLTNLQPWQMTAIRTGGQISTGVEDAGKLIQMKKGLSPDKVNNVGNLSNRNWKHLEPKNPSVQATPDWLEKYGAK